LVVVGTRLLSQLVFNHIGLDIAANNNDSMLYDLSI